MLYVIGIGIFARDDECGRAQYDDEVVYGEGFR